jgi:WXXGXW repeat (2 copies)
VAPPPLRVYVQPPCPSDGYIWTPGYWAYSASGYTWVPGAWVLPPQTGFLFTPGYWELIDGAYLWHHGHWGLHVGYYGGVNYGFGYIGTGFAGGRWEGGHFFYNREVSNIGERFHNVYREKVVESRRGGASFHDRREDRRADRGEERRDDRKADRKEHGDSHSHPGAKSGAKEREHTAKAAAGNGGKKSGHRA